MSEDDHFDALLGGTEQLPPTLSVSRFVLFRKQEVDVMKNSLLAYSGSKLAFQTLPKHMRRRAMSHNVKRLPRRLRQIHLNQMKKSGMPSKQKRPSRKYRRRPKVLTEEYTRRSNRKCRWLQTHIWHAKRFHMVEKWGHKLPCHPRDKAFRACYRAVVQHCLLQDVSYISCLEICGDKNTIVDRLKPLCPTKYGLSIGAKAFISGKREGRVVLYNTEPIQKAVGSVNFHWQHKRDDFSTLWIWVHAAFYRSVNNMLVHCLRGSDVKICDLRNELSRFSLTGPLANSVLHDAFTVLDVNNVTPEQFWLKDYIVENKQGIMKQYEYWQSISSVSSVSEISPHIIISLLVKDPQVNLPSQKTKAVSKLSLQPSNELLVSEEVSCSPLWEEKCRTEINTVPVKDKTSQSDVLVPGVEAGHHDSYLPVILIQRPGNRKDNVGLGSGWDVIIPAAWAKRFWLALIMRGARVGGLREAKCLLFEMGNSQLLQVDTEAGRKDEEQTTAERIDTFFKKPPNKRVNYNKNGIVSPFAWNWKLLVNEWRKGDHLDEYEVLRDTNVLNMINEALSCKADLAASLPDNCLLPVTLECHCAGAPLEFAIICLAKSSDDFNHLPLETHTVDKYELQRKNLRKSHQELRKKIRKRRKLKSNIIPGHYLEELKSYTKKIRAMWLPEPTTVRYSCSREVIGFVKKGGFSFSRGKGFANGYISANALSALLNTDFRNKVLFRNTSSKQYYSAKLSIILK